MYHEDLELAATFVYEDGQLCGGLLGFDSDGRMLWNREEIGLVEVEPEFEGVIYNLDRLLQNGLAAFLGRGADKVHNGVNKLKLTPHGLVFESGGRFHLPETYRVDRPSLASRAIQDLALGRV